MARAYLLQRQLLFQAFLSRHRTARGETAAGLGIDGACHLAFNNLQLAPLF